MEERKPLLRPIDRSAAERISPWPERIAGTKPWTKPTALTSETRAEYEQGWYAALLTEWTRFYDELPPHQRHPGSVLSFFDRMRRANNDAMKANVAVYGSVDLEEFLVSAADQLYAADVNLFEVLWRALVVERAAWALSLYPFEVIVEAGCGNGVNLFNLYLRLGLTSIAGCDLSRNAIKFLTRLADDLKVETKVEAGSYCDTRFLGSLAPESKSWALISVHAIEQTDDITVDWFKNLVNLPNPPAIGMHFEPLQWGDDSEFARECARYAQLCGYNENFLNAVRAAEASGLIEVICAEKRVLGHSAYNPTSVLMWTPRQTQAE